jgi:hypothetical protein
MTVPDFVVLGGMALRGLLVLGGMYIPLVALVFCLCVRLRQEFSAVSRVSGPLKVGFPLL